MTKIREITWPEDFVELKRIEESMVCGICYEYMETSVITPCSHNYCSLCIRKYLHYKTQCPACFHVFFEKDLYVNRTMDHFIQCYIQLREKLINLIQNKIICNSVLQEKQETPKTPPIRPARNIQSPRSPKVIETKESDIKSPNISSPLANSSNYNVSSPSTSKNIPFIAKMFNTSRRKEVIHQPINVSTKTVACPVCSVEISENNINVHLDACLKREVDQGIVKAKPLASKRSTMPKLVLRVMKDAELRKKMREFGLSTQGDRKTLENRFTRYSTIYNAECDKLEPRSIAELIKQCEIEEKQERKLDSFLVSATTVNRLQIERNAKEEAINEAQKKYREANKSDFDKLIEEVKLRKKLEEVKEVGETTNKPSTSSGIENTLENILENDDACTTIESKSLTFQDSDSDETCPLQHYNNDDTVSYLSVNTNDSSPISSTVGSPVRRPQPIFTNNILKANKLETCQQTTTNIEEVITDELTDDDVPASPILNKKNRKRVRLSNKQVNKSSSSLSIAQEIHHESVVQNDREALARNMCNSIINDFTFDTHSDESSNEFVDKLGSENNPEIKAKEKIKRDRDVNQSNLQEKLSSLEKKITEEKENSSIVNNNMNSPVNEFSFDILNGSSSDESLNITIVETNLPAQEVINETPHLNIAPLEKENDAPSANENTQFTVSNNTIRRPVRKRTPTVRYSENNAVTENIKKRASTSNRNKESRKSESSNTVNNTVSSDSSLKRRRGKPKTNSTDHPSDESIQNPPKRPIRRRQIAPDRNLS